MGEKKEKEIGDCSQRRELLDAKLALWGTRRPGKVVDSDSIKAAF